MTNSELKNIWSVPKYLPYVQPELTPELLEQAQKQIGYKLPEKLVEILKIQNGGYIRYKIAETPQEQIMGIGPYFPSLTDFDWAESKQYVSFELDGLVPLDGDGHWYICLDYREHQEDPQVTWIDLECDHQEILANSFAEYVELLTLDVNEGDLVIQTEHSIEKNAKQIEQILEIKFESPEHFNSGYASYRGKYKDSWIWLTPNQVPAGFVREDDKRYHELKDQMSFSSVQYLDIPENDLFLVLSEEELNSEVMEKLGKHDIKITPITELLPEGS